MGAEFDFTGKTALVTGAASGIGAACAAWLARRGMSRILLVDLNERELHQRSLRCETVPFAGDVSDPALWECIEAEAGPVNHAVINAGVASGAPLTGMSFEEWRRVLSVNLDGAFLSLRTALRLMPNGGSAVLTASVAGLKAEPNTGAYATSKAGVIQLAKVAAKEAAARGIRVNAIAPGAVDTPIWDGLAFFEDLTSKGGTRASALDAMAQIATPLRRYAEPDEIAGQIGFLLSDMARNITGTVLVSDGGFSL